MRKKLIIAMLMTVIILFSGCQTSESMLVGVYNTIDEAVLDSISTTEYELIDQVDFENAVVLSIVDQDNASWIMSLYKNNDKFYGFQIEAYESVNFLHENNFDIITDVTKLKLPEVGIMVHIAFLDKTDKIVTDNYDNDYIQLETVDMNVYIMVLDEISEDYIINVDGKEYALG